MTDRVPSAWYLGAAFAACGAMLIALGRWRTTGGRVQGTQTTAADINQVLEDKKVAVDLV